jgi:hypothetical protein
MQCPICAAPARHLTEDLDGLVVTCRHCGEFQITDAALNELLRLGLEERRAALQAAKSRASSGARPMIIDLAHSSTRSKA